MTSSSPIWTLRTACRILPAFAAIVVGFFLSSCNDSGVDSDTAQYIVGDDKDTGTGIPDLQKAYIEAGIVGEGGNALVSDFVNFSRLTEYRVDTLPDGTVLGLRDLHLKALFGDPKDPSVRHNFYPLHEVQFRVTKLAAGDMGQTAGTPVDLQGDPTSRGTPGGLKALFMHNGTIVDLVTSDSDPLRHGYAYITNLDTAKRTIGLHVEADLTNPVPRNTPNRVVDRIVVRIDLQLPY